MCGEKPTYLSEADQMKLVEELIRNRVFGVTLTGGEPLGVISHYEKSILHLKEAGVALSMNSNLALLSEEKVKLLKRLGIRSILTSLLSAEEDHNDDLTRRDGSHGRTLRGIKLAVSHGFPVAINMVVTKKNLATIRETGRLAKELGAMAFCATKVTPPTNCTDFSDYELSMQDFHQMFRDLLWVKDTYDIRIDSLEHYPACAFPDDRTRSELGGRNCSAGKTGCTIGPDAQMRPCSHVHATYGSVLDGFSAAWDRLAPWRDGDYVSPGCKDESVCGEYANGCGGGCRLETYVKTRSFTGPDPYCLQCKPRANFVPLVSQHTSAEDDGKYRRGSGLQHRVESFGHLVYHSDRNWIPMDDTLFGVIFGESDVIYAENLASAYGASREDAVKTLQYLAGRRIVTK